MIDVVAPPALPVNATLSAVPVTLTEFAPRGTAVAVITTPFGITATAGSVFMHPLDWIAARHPNDPYGRLDEAMAWILKRANERFDALEANLGKPAR